MGERALPVLWLLRAAVGSVPFVRCEHVLDDAENPLLLVPWKLAHFFKHAARFADRSGTALLCGLASNQSVNGDAQDLRQCCELLRTQRDCLTFPKGVCPLRNTELLRDLSLSQSGFLTQGMETRSKRRTWPLRWSASLHDRSIRQVRTI